MRLRCKMGAARLGLGIIGRRWDMREVLCYGDSNTWGYDPRTKGRYPRDVRWAGVLRQTLGEGYHVIEEGLNGRTTVWDDPIEGHKNGREYLIPCLETHRPLDLVIILLGTNDLKVRFSLSAYDIANGAGVLAQTVLASGAGRAGRAPEVLLVAPPRTTRLTDFAQMFAGADVRSALFAEEYRRVADQVGCHYLDAGAVVRSSELDGIHLEPDAHCDLGLAIAAEVRRIVPAE